MADSTIDNMITEKTDVKKFTFRKKKFIMVANGKKEPP